VLKHEGWPHLTHPREVQARLARLAAWMWSHADDMLRGGRVWLHVWSPGNTQFPVCLLPAHAQQDASVSRTRVQELTLTPKQHVWCPLTAPCCVAVCRRMCV
jgi:hypothetical protein